MEEGKEEKKSKAATPPPKLASYILSASVGGYEGRVELPQPISFTMSHIKVGVGLGCWCCCYCCSCFVRDWAGI